MKTIFAIDVRNMHTAIHHLFPIKCKPMTTLKAFKDLSLGNFSDDESEGELWRIISKNCEENFEINYRFIDASSNYQNGDQKYHILNSCAYDIYGL